MPDLQSGIGVVVKLILSAQPAERDHPNDGDVKDNFLAGELPLEVE